jgi:hypothetical protein
MRRNRADREGFAGRPQVAEIFDRDAEGGYRPRNALLNGRFHQIPCLPRSSFARGRCDGAVTALAFWLVSLALKQAQDGRRWQSLLRSCSV